MHQNIREKILKEAEEVDGKRKLSCKKAYQIAEELGVETKEIGKTCNEEGIKIYACQLGCF